MPQERQEPQITDYLLDVGEGAPSIEAKVERVRSMRGASEELSARLDRFLVERLHRTVEGLYEAKSDQARLAELIDKLTCTPWHPAVFQRQVETPVGPRAMVLCGTSSRIVGLAHGLDHASFSVGDEVFLSAQMNVIMSASPQGQPPWGETAYFERGANDGRIVLKWRDEEVVVAAAPSLATAGLQPGDLVRWDRAAWIAYEKLARSEGKRYILAEVPVLGRDRIGGQDDNIEALLSALTLILVAPDTARLYGLGARNSILLIGPPGCGKTLLARLVASEISRMSGRKCRFGVVKPAEWEDPFVGVTQQNIRNCFKALREAAREGFAVLFLDEIESIGRLRGGAVSQHADKFLAALLAELDGFNDRESVAIIAASNRKDLIDPALLERLSDMEITVGRPDRKGAEAIFAIHLPESLPYNPNGRSASSTRREIIEAAVSRFYTPTDDNALCVLRFRDGQARTVAARELASGRLFEQVCRAARQSACLRDTRGADPKGLCLADMESAVAQSIQRLSTTLTPRNAHAYLADLRQDVDVVSVEPVPRKVRRPLHYMNMASARP